MTRSQNIIRKDIEQCLAIAQSKHILEFSSSSDIRTDRQYASKVRDLNFCGPHSSYNCLTNTSWQIFDPNTANNNVLSVLFTPVTSTTVYSYNATILNNANVITDSTPVGVTAHDLILAFNKTLTGSSDPNSTAGLIAQNIITVLEDGTTEQETAIASDLNLGVSCLVTPVIMFRESFLDHFAGRQFNMSNGQTLDLFLTKTRGRYFFFQRWPIIVYCTVATLLWLVCTVTLISTFSNQSPPNSAFPIVDFVSRFLATDGDDSVVTIFESLGGGDTKAIRAKLKDKRVYLGDLKQRARRDIKAGVAVEAEEVKQRIGFSLNEDGVGALMAGKKYE